jgi:chromate transporter
MPGVAADTALVHPALDVFTRFLRLGLGSFGGPVAHLGYFRREFVERAGWLDDAAYGEIVALCSVLPGPTSSQVGMAIGARHAGTPGAVLAWVGFTAPSALVMGAFGFFLNAARGVGPGREAAPRHALGNGPLAGPLEGLECVAAAVVLVAVLAMARTLLTSRFAYVAAALAFAAEIFVSPRAPGFSWTVLVASGVAGALFAPPAALPAGSALPRGSRSTAIAAATLFLFGLFVLPVFAGKSETLALFTTMFRAGSLVFGGGHVVLPFLESLVRSGAVDESRFLFGYGAAQAIPGPLFTFAAYLGAADIRLAGAPIAGAIAALLGIFAPTFLLLTIVGPLWGRMRSLPRAANVLSGLNAGVVGILAAVLVNPIGATVVRLPLVPALGIAASAFALLRFGRVPSWAVVLAGAGAGALFFAYGMR